MNSFHSLDIFVHSFFSYLIKKLTERADENARELAVLRVQDDELKATVNRLEQELLDARQYHTPVRFFFLQLSLSI